MMFPIGNTSIRVEENWEAWEMQEVLSQLQHAVHEIEKMIISKNESDKVANG